MGAGINARSQWMSTDVHDASTYSDCAISYNLDVDWDWPKLCTVVEHELGHLAGHDHVNDPHDVMSPYYVYPSSECAAGSSPAATPTPEPAQASQTASSSAKHKKVKRTAAARKAAARKAAKARAAKARAAKARAAKARAAKARAAKARAAKARAAKARAAKARGANARSRGRARVAVSADSSAHAGLFACALVSA
jgi:hypothetical protein